MPSVQFMLIPIVAFAVVAFAVGFLWYGPLFGRQWSTLMGFAGREAELQANAGPAYAASVGGSLVTGFVLSNLIAMAGGGGNVMNGAMTGFMAWLGFMAPVGLSHAMFSGRNKQLLAIDLSYQLVYMVLGGAAAAMLMG